MNALYDSLVKALNDSLSTQKETGDFQTPGELLKILHRKYGHDIEKFNHIQAIERKHMIGDAPVPLNEENGKPKFVKYTASEAAKKKAPLIRTGNSATVNRKLVPKQSQSNAIVINDGVDENKEHLDNVDNVKQQQIMSSKLIMLEELNTLEDDKLLERMGGTEGIVKFAKDSFKVEIKSEGVKAAKELKITLQSNIDALKEKMNIAIGKVDDKTSDEETDNDITTDDSTDDSTQDETTDDKTDDVVDDNTTDETITDDNQTEES